MCTCVRVRSKGPRALCSRTSVVLACFCSGLDLWHPRSYHAFIFATPVAGGLSFSGRMSIVQTDLDPTASLDLSDALCPVLGVPVIAEARCLRSGRGGQGSDKTPGG